MPVPRLHDPNKMMIFGSASLALGLLLPWIFPHSAPIGAGTRDFLRGLLLGLSIAFSLMAIRKRVVGRQ